MKKIISILFLSSLLLLGTSCKDDFLQTNPTDAMSADEASKDATSLNGILDGTHNMFYMYPFGQAFGYGAPSLNAQLDFLGDDVINTLPAYYMGVYRWEDHRDIYGSINYRSWDFYYTIIQHVNTVIHGCEKLEAPEEEKAAILGEALMIRAYCYGNLVQLFGKRYVKGGNNNSLGVILRLGPNYDPIERSTVEQTYKQINADIQEGITNLQKGVKLGRKNRVGLAAGAGIAARIALAQQDWAGAEKYATMAIKGSKARLCINDELLDGFNNLDNPEWIWGYRQASDQNTYYGHFNAQYAYNYDGHNQGLKFAVNRDIYDKMGENDIRRKWFVCLDRGDKIPKDASVGYFLIDEETGENKWETTGNIIKFYTPKLGSTMGDVVMMRLGEMYYIKAEAEARQGKEGAAKTTLNTVMQTRDPEYDCANFSGNNLIDEIFRNKRVDMIMEGVRFFDMKRTGTLVDRLHVSNSKYMTDKQRQTFVKRNSEANVKNIAKTVDAKEWQFLIPYDEIKGNKLCEQNEL